MKRVDAVLVIALVNGFGMRGVLMSSTRVLAWFFLALTPMSTQALGLDEKIYDVMFVRKPATSEPSKSKPTENELMDRAARWVEDSVSWLESKTPEQVEIRAQDGIALSALYLPSRDPSDKTVVLFHGFFGKRTDMAPYARFYHETLGYHILLPDARGHGQSGGDYLGYGWPDRRDAVSWARWVSAQGGSNIVFHGVSMGAATVLAASGETDLPDEVRAVVADSAYTSTFDLVVEFLGLAKMPKKNAESLAKSTSAIVVKKLGFSLEESSALNQVKRSGVPVLFIRGEADSFLPPSMHETLVHACPSPKMSLAVPEANHGMSYLQDPSLYESTLRSFLSAFFE